MVPPQRAPTGTNALSPFGLAWIAGGTKKRRLKAPIKLGDGEVSRLCDLRERSLGFNQLWYCLGSIVDSGKASAVSVEIATGRKIKVR